MFVLIFEFRSEIQPLSTAYLCETFLEAVPWLKVLSLPTKVLHWKLLGEGSDAVDFVFVDFVRAGYEMYVATLSFEDDISDFFS